jgi:hypothetical protein
MTNWIPLDREGVLVAALAATRIPATVAAWAAAALRAGQEEAVEALWLCADNVIFMSWTQWARETVLGVGQGGGPGGRVEPHVVRRMQRSMAALPGGDLMLQRERAFTAADYERMATEIMPQTAERMRSAQAAVLAQRSAALALAEARALATRPCANPRCMRIVGCREREARGRRCSGCMVSRYCCRKCQVAGWKAHKGVCGELAAEREAAAQQTADEEGAS